MSNENKVQSIELRKKLLESLGFELRTLLNGFVGPIQLLKYKLDDPELVEIFRLFDSSTSRLERLALRTSMLQNFDSSSFVLDRVPINLRDLVKFSILDLQPIAELENVTIKIDGNNQVDSTILGDTNALLQTFIIVFEMAINLSNQNETINVNFSSNDNEIVCQVVSPSATFSADLNIQPYNGENYYALSWDILLAKSILFSHNAYLSLLSNSSETNSIIIAFKKG